MRIDLNDMLERLDAARHASRDQPDGPAYQVTWTHRTGKRGRPRKEINADWLARMAVIRDKPGIAVLVDASARTVRRRLVDYNLSSPGTAFAQRHYLEDGSFEVVYNGQPRPPPSLSNAEVDAIVSSHLEIFPNFGRSMIVGSFTYLQGHIFLWLDSPHVTLLCDRRPRFYLSTRICPASGTLYSLRREVNKTRELLTASAERCLSANSES
jgi:hypothetical protein